MTRAQGLSDFASGLGDTLKIDGDNNRVGINSTTPTEALDVVGNIKATGTISGSVNQLAGDISVNTTGIITASKLVGDGSELTGVSGFATALSSDQTSILNKFFKTPTQINVGAGTSLTIESDAASGNVAFVREGIIHVAVGATFHVKSNHTLVTNVLGVF
jgi:hypothetical protein